MPMICRYACYLLFSCCVFTGLTAQSLERYASSNGGGQNVSGSFELSWTIGEAVSGSFTPAPAGITAGFEQPVPLQVFPVEWLDFVAEWKANVALLNWQTTREVNHAYFEVERSADGVMFMPIAQVHTGKTLFDIHHYTYADLEAITLSNPLIYYRLKQVDIDGFYTYSKIVRLQTSADPHLPGATLFPNPAAHSCTLKLNGKWEFPLFVDIQDIYGKNIWQTRWNPDHQASVLHIPTADLAEGLYFIRLQSDYQIQIYPLVIKHD